jgi:cytochrome c-type biogenesis protein CcmH/NrfF
MRNCYLAVLTAIMLDATIGLCQPSDVSISTDHILAEIMSPYCPGRLLRDCPSGQALQLKEKILEDLIATFGEEVRAAPRARGFGLVAWLAPSAFLFFGLILTVLWLKNRSLSRGEEPVAPSLDAEAEERLSRLID